MGVLLHAALGHATPPFLRTRIHRKIRSPLLGMEGCSPEERGDAHRLTQVRCSVVGLSVLQPQRCQLQVVQSTGGAFRVLLQTFNGQRRLRVQQILLPRINNLLEVVFGQPRMLLQHMGQRLHDRVRGNLARAAVRLVDGIPPPLEPDLDERALLHLHLVTDQPRLDVECPQREYRCSLIL